MSAAAPSQSPTDDLRAELRRHLVLPLWAENLDTLCVGRLMGWSKTTAYRAADERWIPTLRAGRRIVVSTQALLDYIDEL
jgi:hypothetical protein